MYPLHKELLEPQPNLARWVVLGCRAGRQGRDMLTPDPIPDLGVQSREAQPQKKARVWEVWGCL
jgi:hypothetical protein